MTFKLLAEHHLEFLSLEGGCTGLSESTLVKMSQLNKDWSIRDIYPLLSKSPYQPII